MMNEEAMEKGFIVLDIPKSAADCFDCPCLNKASMECSLQDDDANFDADTLEDLLEHCPIKRFPKRMGYERNDAPDLYAIGWNNCLKELNKIAEEDKG